VGSSSVERHHLAEYMAIRCCRAVVNAEEEIGVTGRADKLKWFEPNEAAAFLGVDSVRAGQVKSLAIMDERDRWPLAVVVGSELNYDKFIESMSIIFLQQYKSTEAQPKKHKSGERNRKGVQSKVSRNQYLSQYQQYIYPHRIERQRKFSCRTSIVSLYSCYSR